MGVVVDYIFCMYLNLSPKPEIAVGVEEDWILEEAAQHQAQHKVQTKYLQKQVRYELKRLQTRGRVVNTEY